MENEILMIASTIEAISSRADGTWSIRVGTQELNEENARAILRLNRKLGYFIFKETSFEESDLLNIPEARPEFRSDRTPSQRLRARMFVYYKEINQKEEGFNQWYASSLEKIGQTYLDKLENDYDKNDTIQELIDYKEKFNK